MSKSQDSTVTKTRDGFSGRVRCGQGRQLRLTIRLSDEKAAKIRHARLSELAKLLVSAGKAAEALVILRKGATVATEAEFGEVVRFAEALCKDSPRAAKKLERRAMTFRELGELWTKGKLHRDYPDHVRLKRSAKDDEYRLAVLCKTIGDAVLSDFRLEDAERAMAAIPEGRSPASRRQYAQLISKVLKLAVYPLRIIERSPLPIGFLPSPKGLKATAWLYPDEDAQLLACDMVPLLSRVLYGFLAREGLRLGEALSLRWCDLDLDRGVVTLDRNKTDEPRVWALTAGVPEALKAFKPTEAQDEWLVFGQFDAERSAEDFRRHLKLAHVERAELHAVSETRRPIRVHDLRATFVTLSLAAGRSEAWVADRTGHRSSVMINRYRRAARTAAELGLGSLQPLDQALGVRQRVRHESASPIPVDGESHAISLQCTREDSNLHAFRRRNLNPETADTTGQHQPIPAPAYTPSDLSSASVSPESRGVSHESERAVEVEDDDVEAALARGIDRATAAGQWDVVALLAGELQARRLARAGVPSLPSARKRGGVQ